MKVESTGNTGVVPPWLLTIPMPEPPKIVVDDSRYK